MNNKKSMSPDNLKNDILNYFKEKHSAISEKNADKEFLKSLIEMDGKAKVDIDKLQNFAIRKLSKEYDINVDSLPEIVIFSNEKLGTTSGTYNPNSNKIKLNDKFLSGINYDLTNTLDTMLHEFRHWAQYRCKRLDEDRHNFQTMYTPKCHDLCRALAIQYLSPSEYKDYINDKNLEKIQAKLNIYLQKYEAILLNNYYSSEMEMDSRAFSLNTLSDLFSINLHNLNKLQSRSLEILRSNLNLLLDNEEDIMTHTQVAQSIQQKDLQQEICNLQESALKNNPNLLKDIVLFPNLVQNMYNTKNQYKVLKSIIESLRFHFNPELAHKVYKALMDSLTNMLYDGRTFAREEEILKNSNVIKEFSLLASELQSITGFKLSDQELNQLVKCNNAIKSVNLHPNKKYPSKEQVR